MRRFAATLAHVLVLIRSMTATADRVHNPPYRPRLGASKSSNEITRIGRLLLIRRTMATHLNLVRIDLWESWHGSLRG